MAGDGLLGAGQGQISAQHPMMTDDASVSSAISTPTAETVQLKFFTGGTLTDDAGEAAGTVVIAQLANKNILNELGSAIGTFNDTSLSFTSTALTNEVKLLFSELEAQQFNTLEEKLTIVTEDMEDGDYAVDYRTGTFYGKKASTTFTLTSTTYKINKGISGGGGGVASEIEGNVPAGDPDSGNPVKTGGLAVDPVSMPTPVDLLDRVDSSLDTQGREIIYRGMQSDLVNDSVSAASIADADVTGVSTLLDTDADNTAQELKGTPGNLYGFELQNPNGTDAWVQMFDAATGSVTVGTTTPKLTFQVPTTGINEKVFTAPVSFFTAMTYAATTTATGGTDPTTGLIVNFLYK